MKLPGLLIVLVAPVTGCQTQSATVSIVAGEDYALGNMGMPQWYGVKLGMNF